MIRDLGGALLKFILNDSFLAPRLGAVDTNFFELGFVVCRPWSGLSFCGLSSVVRGPWSVFYIFPLRRLGGKKTISR